MVHISRRKPPHKLACYLVNIRLELIGERAWGADDHAHGHPRAANRDSRAVWRAAHFRSREVHRPARISPAAFRRITTADRRARRGRTSTKRAPASDRISTRRFRLRSALDRAYAQRYRSHRPEYGSAERRVGRAFRAPLPCFSGPPIRCSMQTRDRRPATPRLWEWPSVERFVREAGRHTHRARLWAREAAMRSGRQHITPARTRRRALTAK